jgi:hypothetical protein
VKLPDVDSWVMLARPLTGAGAERLVVEPSPSSPSLLTPHACTVPSRMSATTWLAPATTRAALVMPTTGAGAAAASVRPSPSWPAESSPQARNVPSACSATLWRLPAATMGVAA